MPPRKPRLRKKRADKCGDIQTEVYVTPSGQGIIKRLPNGLFAPGTKSHSPITHANARDYQARQQAKYKLAALRAVNDAVAQADIPIPADVSVGEAGWYGINYHAASQLVQADNPRGIADLMRVLGSTTGIHDRDDKPAVGDVTIGSDVRALIADIADIARAQAAAAGKENSADD
jgi:hypothetical protein